MYVQEREWLKVEKQASRIIDIRLYCEYLTRPFSRWSLLQGAGFGG